ncbi:MAG: hypothetical protein ACLP59_05810 [Bryobacteraceae bacterium]
MPETVQSDLEAILRALRSREVDFIVVGGVAGFLEGAPLNTIDLDIVHSREPGNIARLLAALDVLAAVYRTNRELKPDASHLSSAGHQRLVTRFGPLDVLGSIGRSHDYEDLLPNTIEVDLGGDLRARILNLETLIAIKEEVGGDKDLAALPTLRQTLAEKRRRHP